MQKDKAINSDRTKDKAQRQLEGHIENNTHPGRFLCPNNLARSSTNSKLGSFPIKETKQVKGKTDENKILSVPSMKHINPTVSKETIDLVNLEINYLPKHCSSGLKSSSLKTEPDGAGHHPTLRLAGSSSFAINPAFLCVPGSMFR